ncbi:hypothetical protein [Bacteroidetes bacterium endosymbiont of Geopemphigus sp.]|uniref:hypothetical protein n=1 Tax=Bacteroidetes bacterium endosymbiont of Geopemphigus sp. TaxID=2047937 RepID=UPI000CD1109C|nr:hypothetical protein [Bacteroidetes bacterium endosymbiont of Geopemphigus sp.]
MLFKEPKVQLNSSRNTITTTTLNDRNQEGMAFYILDYDSEKGTLKTLRVLKNLRSLLIIKLTRKER